MSGPGRVGVRERGEAHARAQRVRQLAPMPAVRGRVARRGAVGGTGGSPTSRVLAAWSMGQAMSAVPMGYHDVDEAEKSGALAPDGVRSVRP